MRRQSAIAFVALLSVAVAASTASALSLPSKNKKGSVCSAGWEVTGDSLVQIKNLPGNHKLDCADGSDCDADGEVNGSCTVTLTACAAPAVDGCTPQAVTEFKFAPKKKIDLLRSGGFGDPPTGVTEQACGTPGTVVLATRPKKNGTVKPSKPFKAVMKFKDAGKGVSKVLVRCVEGDGGTTTTTLPSLACANGTPGTPKQASYTVPIAQGGESNGSDLDNGWTGTSHNFPTVGGSTLSFCLANCDATSDPLCEGSVGPTGADSVNGRTFGPPLPLFTANVPVCVVNVFQEAITADINLQTGETTGLVKLFAETYTPTPTSDICPRCVSSGGIGSQGTCSGSAKTPRAACTVEGIVRVAESGGDKEYKLSGSCLPSANLAGTLDIQLPITTNESRIDGSLPCKGNGGGLPPRNDACSGAGTCSATCSGPDTCPTTDDLGRCIDSKGGIAELCCSNDTNQACFPTADDSGNAIVRTGNAVVPLPAWPDPTYPKTAAGNVFAAVFCEDETGSTQVNSVTGLPGPGALLLPGDVQIVASE